MSKLSVSCPSCAKRYGVPEEYAGKKFKCKDCGATISIPATAAEPEPEEPIAVDEDEPAPPKRKKSTKAPNPKRACTMEGTPARLMMARLMTRVNQLSGAYSLR